jgi:protein-tyrosine phosphatase
MNDIPVRYILKESPNFRDLGGYRNREGNHVRQGQIFRSGHFATLESKDQNTLKELGIRTVCDLRSIEEITAQPNRLPPNGLIETKHMPIVNQTIEPTLAVSRIMKGDIGWFNKDFMIKGYIEKVDAFADVWREFFKVLIEKKNRPLVFHCTAGKDRTGVGAALILLSLGVSEERVVYDHQLSNTYNAERTREIEKRIAKTGLDPKNLKDYLTAPESAVVALIDHLNTNYGSATGYLIRKAHVDEQWLEQLRNDMLE